MCQKGHAISVAVFLIILAVCIGSAFAATDTVTVNASSGGGKPIDAGTTNGTQGGRDSWNASDQSRGTPSSLTGENGPNGPLVAGNGDAAPSDIFSQVISLVLGLLGYQRTPPPTSSDVGTPDQTNVSQTQARETTTLSSPLRSSPASPMTTRSFAANTTYTLSILSKPTGALVFLDGAYTGSATPILFPAVTRGNHRIKIEMDGYSDREENIAVHSDMTVEFELSPCGAHATQRELLLSLPDPKNGHSGGLYITSIPEDQAILIDNKQIDWRTPHVVGGLKEGLHSVEVRVKELESDVGAQKVWVYPGMTANVNINLIGTPRIRTITIASQSYPGEQFSMNGAYPLHTIPETITVLGAGDYITIKQGGAYISYLISDALEDHETLQIESEKRQFYTLTVETEPRGCDVFIDGYPTGLSTPNRFNVSDGFHQVMVQRSGYLPKEKRIDLIRSPNGLGVSTLGFTLDDYAFGHLGVNSSPMGASIYLFGKSTGEKTPHTFQYIPIGSYDVKIVNGTTTSVIEDVVVSPWEFASAYASLDATD